MGGAEAAGSHAMSRDECLPEGSRPSRSRSGARSGPWTDPWRRQVARPVPVESGARQASPVAGIAAGLGLTYGLAAMHRQSITDGTTTLTSATAVGVAVLCYLAAAATRTRWIAWVGVPVFSGVAFAGLLGFLPWWVLFVLAGVVLLVAGTAAGAPGRGDASGSDAGLLRLGHRRPAPGASRRLALAALALAAHAAGDVRPYRQDLVVARSMAIFCIGLDLTVGAICVALAVVV